VLTCCHCLLWGSVQAASLWSTPERAPVRYIPNQFHGAPPVSGIGPSAGGCATLLAGALHAATQARAPITSSALMSTSTTNGTSRQAGSPSQSLETTFKSQRKFRTTMCDQTLARCRYIISIQTCYHCRRWVRHQELDWWVLTAAVGAAVSAGAVTEAGGNAG
jgi:hypothetical protein